MIVTVGPYLYTKLAKISSRVESCLCLVLGKVAEGCVEFSEVLGLNLNTEEPSLTRALKHAVDAQMAFYSHLIPVGIMYIGQEHHIPTEVVNDACVYLPANRPTFAASYSPLQSEPLVVHADSKCTVRFVGTASDAAVIRTLFPETTKSVQWTASEVLSDTVPPELLPALAMALQG